MTLLICILYELKVDYQMYQRLLLKHQLLMQDIARCADSKKFQLKIGKRGLGQLNALEKIPDLLPYLLQKIAQNNITLDNLMPSPSIQYPFYQKFSFEVTFQGRYEVILPFILNLLNDDKALWTISHFILSMRDETHHILMMHLFLDGYKVSL